MLAETRAAVAELGLVPAAVARSPLRGPAGNVEFFMLIRTAGETFDDAALERSLNGGGAQA